MNVVRLRWMAIKLGFEKIILKKNRMIIHFINNPESGYFESEVFRSVLGFVQSQGRKYSMKESDGKLRLSTDNINSISSAIKVLEKMV
jgi:transcription-repair coupling factor (superfamily II helicase)